MKTRLLLRALLAATLVLGMAAGALMAVRATKLETAIERLDRSLARHGLDLKLGATHWTGLTALRIDSLRVEGPRRAWLHLSQVDLRLDAWADGWRRLEAMEWAAGSAGLDGAIWKLKGTLRPSRLGAIVELEALAATARSPLQGLDLRFAALPGRDGLALQMRTGAFVGRHRRLAPAPLHFPPIHGEALLRAGGTTLQLAQGRVQAGGWHAEGHATLELPSLSLSADARSPMLPLSAWALALPATAQDSLPRLLARCPGHLAAQAGLRVPLGRPHDLRLSAQLRDSGFAPLDPEAHFPVNGPLRRATQVPALIVRAVELSEDAHFRQHRGFDVEIMQAALADNIRQGRFARGGGTLSMQLVRNRHLAQDKNLVRKAQEVLLTLLMERGGAVDKDEVMARYLGIIEWGRGIHGIEAAADHYFQKSPSALSPDECLFLCAIIPNPRQAHTLLNPDGSLRDFAAAYFETMRWMLHLEGHLSEAELDKPLPLFPGLAQRLLRPSGKAA